MSTSLREKSFNAFLWVILDKAGSSTMNFVFSIVLGRLLLPADFGFVAMVMVVFAISSAFVDSGFSQALIREKDISEADKSTTFIFNLVTSLVVYTILFLAAPSIAAFFKQDSLTNIIRIMGLDLIINAFAIIQLATLTQQIDFKTQTKARFLAVILSGAVAIILAKMGWGVWSLIAKILVMSFTRTVLYWMLQPWKPTWVFSMASFKRLFRFGSKLLISGLLTNIFDNLYNLLIGKFYNASALGLYTQAGNFANIVIKSLYETIQGVTYPILTKLQDDLVRLKDGFRLILRLCSFLMFPTMALLAILAKPVILMLLGEKWVGAAPFLQLLCISGATHHFHSLNLNMLLVLGRSDIGLYLEILKKVIITISILISIQFGVYALVVSQVIVTYVSLFINSYYSNKFLKYSFSAQIQDVLPSLTFSLVAAGIVSFFGHYFNPVGIFFLFWSTLIGFVIYFGFHLLLQSEEIKLIRGIIIPQTVLLANKFFKPVA